MGLSSTLTLINGRRAGVAPVSNDVGQSFFDINTLPVLLIERVEILRDGASATYGSQAVAGVANVVTRKAFTGLEITGGYRAAATKHTTWASPPVLSCREVTSAFTAPGSSRTRTFAPILTG